jgi:hypothetical protein
LVAKDNVVTFRGTKLLGATGVTFNSKAATITSVTTTMIKVEVPTGATTGYIKVTTPSGTARTATKFKVT